MRYPDTQSLIAALDKVNLPGKEIVSLSQPTKTYSVTGAQLNQLGLKMPEGMMWFYEIRGSRNRLVKRSDAIYATENDAISAGTDYLDKDKATVLTGAVDEVFSVMAGRK